MPTSDLPDELRDLLARPNPAVMASLRKDGQPVSVATWYVLDGEDWYTHVSVQGRVTELRDDVGLVDIDRIAEHYTGRRYGNRDRGRVSADIEVDRWHGWGAARA